MPSEPQLPQQKKSLDRRRPSMSSLKLSHEPPPIPTEPIPRPSTAHSHRSQLPRPSNFSGSSSSPERSATQKKAPPARPERPTESVLSPRFLDQFSAEPAEVVAGPLIDLPSTFSPSQPPVLPRSPGRSKSTPDWKEAEDGPTPLAPLERVSTEPEMRGRERRSTHNSRSSKDSPRKSLVRARSQGRSAPRVDYRLQDAPPVPKPVQQCKQDVTHAPSDSSSSTTSSNRSLGNNSSNIGPSPISSASSSVDAFSPLGSEASHYGEDEKMRVAGLNIKAHQQKPGMRAEIPAQRSPPRSFTRRSPPMAAVRPVEQVPAMPVFSSPPLESPMDPLSFNGEAAVVSSPESGPQDYFPVHRASPNLHRNFSIPSPGPRQTTQEPQPVASPPEEFDPYRASSPPAYSRARSRSNATLQFKTPSHGTSLRPLSPQAVPPPPPVPQNALQAPPPTRRGTSARPTCRGCSNIIEGKSVKAADGRLTGRWHKACFTCRACEQPFTTADFYVIANHPYCEQHYHEKNDSLCHGCNRGIEGQYLETTASSSSCERKFHPRCFTCHDCRRVLSEDYFEIRGRVFCERHALAAMRGQSRMAGPGLQPLDRKALTAERRTTRLMMM
ncbi:hypothetical protein B0A50_05347 [Salinomyces thailandicus]|uniref:LIM zinc-binding domain-containing protein n=1 Tax=Salinomyces thailandicus TaxID=706561 RepID=A0A4U0TVX6_9PEZI|nr:hypothetical protein B0A50_05347 [Salinomyces thailandica]